MASNFSALSLRPMSIGELLDRAFTLYFRHAFSLLALLVVVAVPVALVQYFATKDVLDAYVAILTQVLKSPNQPPDVSKMQAAAAGVGPLTGFYYLLVLVALPLAQAAVIAGVSRAYLGMPVRFVDCYRVALRRWFHILVLIVLWFIAAVSAFFTLGFAIVLVGIAFVALMSLLKTAGAVIAAVFGIALAIAIAGLAVMVYMAFAASFIATVLENVDPVRAFALGFARLFGGGLFWRSVGVSFAVFALYFGVGIVTIAVAAGLFWLTKSAFVYVAVANLANLFFLAFALIVVALYYYDIRIRREGFDLQLLAEQLAVASAAQRST